MAFWTDPTTEPKRAYRWILNIGGIPQWIIKESGKPKYNISSTEHKYLNHTFNYPASLTWQPLSITLVDPVAPDAAATLMDILAASGYHIPENPDDTSTISKARAIEALGRVVVAQLGPDGEIVEEWELVNAFIADDVDFGELSYSSEDMTEIKITIKYDYAVLTVHGEPVPIG